MRERVHILSMSVMYGALVGLITGAMMATPLTLLFIFFGVLVVAGVIGLLSA
jgi:hypothetical protein